MAWHIESKFIYLNFLCTLILYITTINSVFINNGKPLHPLKAKAALQEGK